MATLGLGSFGAASRRALGFTILGGVILLWVGSSILIQKIFEDVKYEKPLLMTVVQTVLSILLLGPSLVRSYLSKRRRDRLVRQGLVDILQEEEESRSPYEVAEAIPRKALMQLAVPLGLLWFGAQLTFNTSLLHTSVATNTVLSSTSSFFTYFLTLVILRDRFHMPTFLAICVSFVGVILIELNTPATIGEHIKGTLWGQSLAVLSAVCYAFFTTLLKKQAPDDRDIDMGFFFGCIGIVIALVGPPLLLIADLTGIESFRMPSWSIWGFLMLNGLLGTVLSDYLWAMTIILLSPVIATVGLSMQIPVSLIADAIVLKEHKFTWMYLFGSLLVFVGVIVVSIAQQPQAPSSGADRTQARGARDRRHEENVRKYVQIEFEDLHGSQDDPYDEAFRIDDDMDYEYDESPMELRAGSPISPSGTPFLPPHYIRGVTSARASEDITPSMMPLAPQPQVVGRKATDKDDTVVVVKEKVPAEEGNKKGDEGKEGKATSPDDAGGPLAEKTREREETGQSGETDKGTGE